MRVDVDRGLKCRISRNVGKLPRLSDLPRPRKVQYRVLVGRAVSDPLEERLGLLPETIRSQWKWTPGTSYLNKTELSLTWLLAQNSFPFASWDLKAGLADMPDSPRCSRGLKETDDHVFYLCDQVRLIWDYVGEVTGYIDPKQFVVLEVGYVMDNFDLPWTGVKRRLFLVTLVVARLMIW